jgi:hypothetical protein
MAGSQVVGLVGSLVFFLTLLPPKYTKTFVTLIMAFKYNLLHIFTSRVYRFLNSWTHPHVSSMPTTLPPHYYISIIFVTFLEIYLILFLWEVTAN